MLWSIPHFAEFFVAAVSPIDRTAYDVCCDGAIADALGDLSHPQMSIGSGFAAGSECVKLRPESGDRGIPVNLALLAASSQRFDMGTTAEKIARHVAAQTKAPVIDLAGHRQMKQLLRDARLDAGGFERRIAEGVDPCYAVYIHAQALISITAEQLAATKEARQFARLAAEAEDIYMPSYPPMSPVTTSHFAMWSLFDLQFGQSHETIGTCFQRIAELTDLPAGLQATASALQSSRLGLYVHCGHDGRFVRLREIGQERIERCLVPAGYRGEAGEIWLARLLPPASVLFDYHVVSTTPYVMAGGSEPAWLAYLDRERRRLRSKPLPRKIDATTYIMKHGPRVNHWNEYIFCAYAGDCNEAIFLTGIPDIKESLPHA